MIIDGRAHDAEGRGVVAEYGFNGRGGGAEVATGFLEPHELQAEANRFDGIFGDGDLALQGLFADVIEALRLGGSIDQAIKDFDKTIALDSQMAEAHLWRGIALRKANRNAEARKSFERSLQLNPKRVWAKQQLEKTPAQ